MTKKIAIVTGGTGGHIFPARSTALALCKSGLDVTILADSKYLKYQQISDPYYTKIINSSSLKSGLKGLVAGARIVLGIFQSLIWILFNRPNTIVAFGGYPTFPVLIAAIILKKKIILHEQNAHLGKVNRIFIRHAHLVALTYKQTDGIAPEYISKTKYVGNPIREEIVQLSKTPYTLPAFEEQSKPVHDFGYDVLLASQFDDYKQDEARESFNILVIGGSGGAKIFSEVLPKAFFNIRDEVKNCIKIIQQCRAEILQQTFDQYKSFNISIEIQSFFDDMPEQIKKAHLIIARSGSSSIAEFTAASKPMILIPFAAAADNHQEKNARFIEAQGGAILIKEQEFTINKITKLLEELIDNPALLNKMSRASFSCADLEATNNFVKLIKS
jgi:UDP-N-acetylglucosamine--N-acetylmuramyl-(pentapeptide) pyrophosphoryl-undecaprenol N-acetylglucosamine transferase